MRRWTLATAASALLAAALWHLPATAQRATPPAVAQPVTGPAVTGSAVTGPAAPVQSTAVPSNAIQPAPNPPAAPELITFDQYRDFRLNDLAQRRERLTRQLSEPELTAAQKTGLQRRRTYYDRLAAMPAEDRDRLFRARFDKIDTDRDGTLDSAERSAWREHQREHYRQLAAERAHVATSAPPRAEAAGSTN